MGVATQRTRVVLPLLRARAVLALLLAATVAPAGGTSITDKLHRFIDMEAFPASGAFIDVVTPVVERLAVRGIDFPVTATTPGVSYRFNFDLGAPERIPGSIGPVFAERARTVGRGRLDLGFSYLHADLTQFEGEDLGPQIRFSGSVTTTEQEELRAHLTSDAFSLVSDIVSFSATYGLADRWDVNVLVPLVWTSLHLAGSASATVVSQGQRVTIGPDRVRFDESAFGVGDVFLRTKYRLLERESVELAAGLTLRLPSGEEGDFHGTGDVTVAPALIASHGVGRQDFHASLGVEMNGDDLERSRARYAVGATLQPIDRLAFLVDLIGSSSFVNDNFQIRAPAGPVFRQSFGLDGVVSSVGATKVEAFVPRSDVVDLALGMKVNLIGTAFAFASAIIPLTDDGLRAEVIPAGGLEVSF